MDPNAALERLRDALRTMDSYSEDVWPDDVMEVVESARALDDWLSRGGFLPTDWKH